MHSHRKIGHALLPSHPLTININGDAKSFHVGNTAVWYGQIPNVIARMNPSIEYQTAMISKYKHEQTIQVGKDNMNHTYLVTFIPTSCY